MLKINSRIAIPLDEIGISAIRAQGAGGQNVNKVATAVHLRFYIPASSLPDAYKQRLLLYKDRRISHDGTIIIKAQRFRSQEKNRADALNRLRELILAANLTQKPRRPTRPSKAAKQKRIQDKVRRGKQKALRGKVVE